MKKFLCFAWLLVVACQPPDSTTPTTPSTKPEVTTPPDTTGPKVTPPAPKEWKYRSLNIDGSNNAGLYISPDMLFIMQSFQTTAGVAENRIRQMLLPQRKEIFPLSFFPKTEASQRKVYYVKDMIFDIQGSTYLLESTVGDIAPGTHVEIRILKFSKNLTNLSAHPREVLAGDKVGYADGKATNAQFGEGIRNMAVSTDQKYLYLADWSNNRVPAVEIQSQQVSTLKLTDAAGNPMSISRPKGIAVGKDNTVYIISNSGAIMAITVPLALPADKKVSAVWLALRDAEGRKVNNLSGDPWYLAIDGSDALYSYIQRGGKHYIVRIVLNEAKTGGVVSEVAEMRGMGSWQIRGLEVNREGTALYYASSSNAHMYQYE